MAGSPTNPAPTLVIDLDGTLVDTAGDLVGTLNFVLKGEGIPPLAFDKARRLIGHGARAMLEAGFRASGITPEAPRMDALFEAFLAHYTEHIAESSAPFPGAVAALDRFTAAGWHLAICTNKLEGLARQLLNRLGLAGRFAVIAGQDTFGARKPDPRHLDGTILHAGGVRTTAIMVGDSEIDVAAARASAVPVIGVSFGYSLVPMAELAPDRVIDHFDALYDAATRLLSAEALDLT